MPQRRPASPGLVVVLTAVGALVAGVAGTAAYLGVSDYLRADADAPTGPDPGTSVTATVTPAPVACPQPTIDAVRAADRPGNLVRVIYVKGATAQGREAEAWICLDSDGTLYYQGHELGRGELTQAQDAQSLLLGAGIRGSVAQEGDTYVGSYPLNNGTVLYRVSPTEFAIVDGNRRTEFSTDFETIS
jgi:hypothetical protein